MHGPEANTALLGHCIRCGDGTAPSCRFHPDAKAFAFGTGRFDYGYTSAWDTPHDIWFCCGAGAPGAAGCCEESTHTVDVDWWQAYCHLAPSLEESASSDDSEEAEEEDDDDAASTVDALAAMEID